MRKTLFSGLRLYRFSRAKNEKCTKKLRGVENYCRAGRGKKRSKVHKKKHGKKKQTKKKNGHKKKGQ